MDAFLAWVFLIGIVGLAIYASMNNAKAPPNPEIMCPHCQTKGSVYVSQVVRKQGISGGKATGALFTGGLSLFATGLSRKQAMTHMRCGNCQTQWDVT